MKIIALIGDIVSSKEIQDRALIQRKLENVLHQLNLDNKSLLSPYTITLGDEFQAVFGQSGLLFYDMVRILSTLSPVKVRFALGVGTLDTPINPKQSIGMDGPAFHAARAGIEELKSGSFLFTIKGIEQHAIDLANQSLKLLSRHLDKWNDTRLHIFEMYNQNLLVKEIVEKLNAEKLKISEQAVYKSIAHGDLEVVQGIFRSVAQVINENIEES